MANVKSGTGFVGVVVVLLANVSPTWAQSEESSGRVRERIGRTLVDKGNPSSAAEFGTRARLTGRDESFGSRFGQALCISGEFAIVGASRENGNEANTGAAYVFRRDEGGVNNWGEVARLTAFDGADGDEFGQFVSISGDTAIVSAYGDDEVGTDSGSAYIYRRDAGGIDNWGLVVKIAANDAAHTQNFGSSLAIDGDTVIVGAHFDSEFAFWSGAAYVFERNEGGLNNWGQVTKITSSVQGPVHLFGNDVAISGDTVIVGASRHINGALEAGAAFVFQRDEGGIGNWGEVTILTASDATEDDAFGWSVAISGDTTVVGARDDFITNDDGAQTGAVYVYRRNEGGADEWGQVVKIIAIDGGVHDHFGQSVDISGDTMIVGVSRDPTTGNRSADVYQRNEGGDDNWGKVTTLAAREVNIGSFGTVVAVDGNTVIMGGSLIRVDVQASFPAAWVMSTIPCSDSEQCTDGVECNGVEFCELETGTCVDGEIDDCDGNGIDDACELAGCGDDPGCDDCDDNGVLDRCDIDRGQFDANRNGVLDRCESSCANNLPCNDSNPCSFDRCLGTVCGHELDVRYGDVAGEAGVCGPDGDVNLSDILAVLDGFAGQFADGCEAVNIDIAGDGGSCVPNGSIDLSDILGVLDAFQGQDNCCAAGG